MAIWKGEFPSKLLFRLILAPCCKSSFNVTKCPFLTAEWSTVSPSQSLALISTPSLRSSFAISALKQIREKRDVHRPDQQWIFAEID